jgi:hypothetical protein
MSPFLKNITIDLSSFSLVAESLDEHPKGPSLFLHDAGYILVDSQMCARGMEVTGKQSA